MVLRGVVVGYLLYQVASCAAVSIRNLESGVTMPASGLNTTQLCPRCAVQISFGDLVHVPMERTSIKRMIFLFKEDIYNRGTFFYNSGSKLMKFTPGKPVEWLLGSAQGTHGYATGNSTTAEFTLIADVIQYNQTIMLIADTYRSCVREYNYETDLVTDFLGNCTGKPSGARPLKRGVAVAAKSHWILYVVSMVLLKSKNCLLTLSYGHDQVGKYNYTTNMAEVLDPELQSNIASPRQMVANKMETELYIVHSYGLSRLNLDTFAFKLLVGEMLIDPEDRDMPFSAGPFSAAKPGLIAKPVWLVQDRVLISHGTKSNENIIIIDLVSEQVYSACEGSPNRTFTITGPPGICEINLPTELAVASDGSIYVGAMAGITSDVPYTRHVNSSLYRMQTIVSRCIFTPPTGHEVPSPNLAVYPQYDKVQVVCPAGLALNASSSIRTCEESSEWDEDLPHCAHIKSADDISSVSPTIGQVSGGTPVMAYGLIPDSGLHIYLNDSDDHTEIRKLAKSDGRVFFTMPRQTFPGIVDIIIKLSDQVTATVPFEYQDDPVVNKIVRSENLVSGGFPVLFEMLNINSSQNYLLNLANGTTYKCTTLQTYVVCDTKALPEFTGSCVTRLPMELYSDGVFVENSNYESFMIYPDPQMDSKSVSLKHGEVLMLEGSHLNPGVLIEEYQITIESVTESSIIVCNILSVKNNSISCQPELGERLPDSKPRNISVRIGELHIIPGQLIFLSSVTATEPSTTATLVAAITVPPLITVIVTVSIIVYCLHRRQAQRERLLSSNSFKLYKENDEWMVRINLDLKLKLRPLLIEPDSLKLKRDEPIGEGNFGKIFLGQLYRADMVKTVAVKTLKELDAPVLLIEKFLEEAVVLEDMNHANVLPTLAVCIPISEKPQVVLPYMANGDLKSLIGREDMKFTFGDLMHFSKQVACGMEYLAANRFIHRDLAARNCLVSDKYIVRIADFGLSRDVYNRDYYRRDETSGVALPIKWLSLESLISNVFNSSSDVWSFGVLMWELCTRGHQPYYDIDAWDMRSYLEEGRRLPQPSYCSPEIWQLMSGCWLEASTNRPTFTMIYTQLDKLLEGVVCNPQSPYSYIRDYTKDISSDYVKQAKDTEVEDYLVPVSSEGRLGNQCKD